MRPDGVSAKSFVETGLPMIGQVELGKIGVLTVIALRAIGDAALDCVARASAGISIKAIAIRNAWTLVQRRFELRKEAVLADGKARGVLILAPWNRDSRCRTRLSKPSWRARTRRRRALFCITAIPNRPVSG